MLLECLCKSFASERNVSPKNTKVLQTNASFLEENPKVLQVNATFIRENPKVLPANASFLRENAKVLRVNNASQENTKVLRGNSSHVKFFPSPYPGIRRFIMLNGINNNFCLTAL